MTIDRNLHAIRYTAAIESVNQELAALADLARWRRGLTADDRQAIRDAEADARDRLDRITRDAYAHGVSRDVVEQAGGSMRTV